MLSSYKAQGAGQKSKVWISHYTKIEADYGPFVAYRQLSPNTRSQLP